MQYLMLLIVILKEICVCDQFFLMLTAKANNNLKN